MARACCRFSAAVRWTAALAILAWAASSPAPAAWAGDPAAPASQANQAAQAPQAPQERRLDQFLFRERPFVFQTLWRTGLIATGGGDLGEILTVASRIKDGDTGSWHAAWNGMARLLRARADGYREAGLPVSAMQAYFRATNAFRAAGVFEYGNELGKAAWQEGRDTFLQAAALSGGRIRPVRIPYEGTTLPGYLVTPEGGEGKRPLFLLQTGLDGTAEDLYLLLGTQIVKRGYVCLIFEGPGQGEMIAKQGLPLRNDWEKVVTPVVDYAVALPEVDPDRMAIFGPSMSVPRALAFEKRIRWGIANGGVWSIRDGSLKLLTGEMRALLDDPSQAAAFDALVTREMGQRLALRHAMNQRLWIFKAATPAELFRTLVPYTLEGLAERIEAEMLVVNSNADDINDSQPQARRLLDALTSRKTFLEFDDSQGAQSHCQVGAPLVSAEGMLNWLDARAKP
jgi:hypothetical protein